MGLENPLRALRMRLIQFALEEVGIDESQAPPANTATQVKYPSRRYDAGRFYDGALARFHGFSDAN
jgi:hypothetical protein